jgi:hypothetical protein
VLEDAEHAPRGPSGQQLTHRAPPVRRRAAELHGV